MALVAMVLVVVDGAEEMAVAIEVGTVTVAAKPLVLVARFAMATANEDKVGAEVVVRSTVTVLVRRVQTLEAAAAFEIFVLFKNGAVVVLLANLVALLLVPT